MFDVVVGAGTPSVGVGGNCGWAGAERICVEADPEGRGGSGGGGGAAPAGRWFGTQNDQPTGAGGQLGSGCQPSGGTQPGGGVGQPGGTVNV